jgi:hypothetical protein
VREKKPPSIRLSNFCTPITGCSRQPPTSITNGPCLFLYPVRQFSLFLWANSCDLSPQSLLSTLVLGHQNSVSLPCQFSLLFWWTWAFSVSSQSVSLSLSLLLW